jgi:hypothetical protein
VKIGGRFANDTFGRSDCSISVVGIVPFQPSRRAAKVVDLADNSTDHRDRVGRCWLTMVRYLACVISRRSTTGPSSQLSAASPNLSFGFGATLSRRARRAASSSRSLRAVRIPLSTVRHLDALFTYTCV